MSKKLAMENALAYIAVAPVTKKKF